ncbi:MAG TPA: Rid family hydrolase [Candidatus Binatia bacterium]|jgi:enamine deaminase RidA (YjgF/YER057c/UK114 family)|nr:Rid family hydrolase [Candidatus Binatia bacterium]
MSERQHVKMPASQGLFDQLGIVEAVRVGNTVTVSGQVGWDEKLEPAVGLEAQARQAFRNLKAVLAKAGARPEHVTHLFLLFVDPGQGTSLGDDAAVVFEAKNEVMPECRPAATGCRVAGLIHPDLLLEVHATAVID